MSCCDDGGGKGTDDRGTEGSGIATSDRGLFSKDVSLYERAARTAIEKLSKRERLYQDLANAVADPKQAFLVKRGRSIYLIHPYPGTIDFSDLSRGSVTRPYRDGTELYWFRPLTSEAAQHVRDAGLPTWGFSGDGDEWKEWLSPPWFDDPNCPSVFCDPGERKSLPHHGRAASESSRPRSLAPDDLQPTVGAPHSFTIEKEIEFELPKRWLVVVVFRLQVVFTRGKKGKVGVGETEAKFVKKLNGWAAQVSRKLATASFDGPEILGTKVKLKIEALKVSSVLKKEGGKAVAFEKELTLFSARGTWGPELSEMAGLPKSVEVSGSFGLQVKYKALKVSDIIEHSERLATRAEKALNTASRGGNVEDAVRQLKEDRRVVKEALEELEEDLAKAISTRVEKEAAGHVLAKRVTTAVASRAGRALLKVVPVLNAISTAVDIVQLASFVIEYVNRLAPGVARANDFMTRFKRIAVPLAAHPCPITSPKGKCRIASLHDITGRQYYADDAKVQGWTHDERGRLIYVRVDVAEDGTQTEVREEDALDWFLASHPGEDEELAH